MSIGDLYQLHIPCYHPLGIVHQSAPIISAVRQTCIPLNSGQVVLFDQSSIRPFESSTATGSRVTELSSELSMIVAVYASLACVLRMETRRNNRGTVTRQPIKLPLSQREVGGSLHIDGRSGEVSTNRFSGKKQPVIPHNSFLPAGSL